MTDPDPDLERYFDIMPPEAEREIWCEWLRRHSINPREVVVPGWIERRPADYQVAYLSIEVAPGPNGRPAWDPETDDFVWVARTAQLEGPPLPFPVDTLSFTHHTLGFDKHTLDT